jgi:predicted RNase H-like HicB family nuclease
LSDEVEEVTMSFVIRIYRCAPTFRERGSTQNHIKYAKYVISYFSISWENRRMERYEIIIYWSMPDNAYVAEVPELAGCAAHGATHEEALANAKEAMRLWLDTAREFGDPIPEPKGRRLLLA